MLSSLCGDPASWGIDSNWRRQAIALKMPGMVNMKFANEISGEGKMQQPKR
jgi:hypothetical protein